jgi:hypothetical protein
MSKANKSQGGIVENLPPTTDSEYDLLLKTNLTHTQADEDAADAHIARKVAEIKAEKVRQDKLVTAVGHRSAEVRQQETLSRIEENIIPRSMWGRGK